MRRRQVVESFGLNLNENEKTEWEKVYQTNNSENLRALLDVCLRLIHDN
jgi:hypothetical protein